MNKWRNKCWITFSLSLSLSPSLSLSVALSFTLCLSPSSCLHSSPMFWYHITQFSNLNSVSLPTQNSHYVSGWNEMPCWALHVYPCIHNMLLWVWKLDLNDPFYVYWLIWVILLTKHTYPHLVIIIKRIQALIFETLTIAQCFRSSPKG
jgi:hypothetical protein